MGQGIRCDGLTNRADDFGNRGAVGGQKGRYRTAELPCPQDASRCRVETIGIEDGPVAGDAQTARHAKIHPQQAANLGQFDPRRGNLARGKMRDHRQKMAA